MPDKLENRRIPYFGDFVLFDEIGRGGMGVVYNAQQTKLDRPVALKVLHSNFAADGAVRQRLRIEAEAAARLEHPNIVPIFEIGEHEGQPYLAMRLIEGESLAERLARLGSNFKERAAAALMAKIAQAVHHAHQRGVLHRDLKPGNILIDESGEPHLIDFGLAKCVEQDSGLTQTGSFLGTPAYASPEQAAGRNKSITTASDVYSLGAVLYALLTGQPPFTGESPAETIEKVKSGVPLRPRSVRSALSANLETICLKCLEKEPARRYASALELAEDLERFLTGRPISARPVRLMERLWMWTRRKPVHAGLVLTATLVIISSLLAVLLWRNARAQERENQSLLDLESAISISRNRSPRQMRWSESIRASLTPERVVTQKSYYRDQVATTFGGWDGRLLARHAQFFNEQVFFSGPDGHLLLAGATNALNWRIGPRTNSNAVNLGGYPGEAVAFPAGSPLQVVQAASGKLLAWSAVEQRILAELESPPGLAVMKREGRVPSAASSAANLLALVMSNSQGGDVLVCWQLPSGKILNALAVDQSATAVAATPDGSLVACGNSAGQVRLWNVPGGALVEQLSLSALPASSLAFAPGIRRKAGRTGETPSGLLAVGDEGGSIGIWNLADRSVQALCRGGHYQVFSLAFSPDNMTLASGGRGPVRLWDAATGAPLLDLLGDGEHYVDYCVTLTFSTNGFRVAASAGSNPTNRQIYVWELQNGRGVATLRGLSSGVTKVAFSSPGDRLAAVGLGWEVGVWDIRQKRLLHVLEAPRGFTADNFALAFNPDGRLLALSTGEEAQLWDVATGRHLRSWKLPPGTVDFMAFPRDDALFLLRLETLQGIEMPLSNAPWRKYPRVCRLRNLLAAEPLKSIAEIGDFNVGVFCAAASSDGRFFAIEGIGSTNETRNRKILALAAATGRTIWERASTKSASWGNLSFSSSGAQLVFTDNGTDYRTVDLDAPDKPSARFSRDPPAIGPRPSLWAARRDATDAERGVSIFEDDTLRLNLGLDSEILIAPCFDPTGRRLAWGNADGTISLCDLEEIRAQLGRSGLAW